MGGRPRIPAPIPPPPPPDYADQAVRDAALAERNKQVAGASRRKSFITSSGANLGGGKALSVAAPSLSGSRPVSQKSFFRR